MTDATAAVSPLRAATRSALDRLSLEVVPPA